MSKLAVEKINQILSEMVFDDQGKPQTYRGYEVKEVKVCQKHHRTFAVSYGDEFATWPIKLGCPDCAREAVLAEKLGQAAIPKRFLEKNFATFKVETTEQKQALLTAKAYALSLNENIAIGRCLVIVGNVGVGKTHLACAIANRAVLEGKSAFFAPVSRLIRMVRSSWGTPNEQSVVDELTNLDLLVIDEIGVQAGTENERNILFDLINGRYENMKSTIVISNLDRTGLAEYLGERIIDRLRENGGQMISLQGKSNRK